MKKLIYKNKKGFSAVVATALLLVVAVVSVVAFGNWFANFQGDIQSGTQTQAQSPSLIITRVSNGSVWLNNRGTKIVEDVKVEINSNDCTPSSGSLDIMQGINKYEISSTSTGCSLSKGDKVNIYVYSTTGSGQGTNTLNAE